MTKDILHILPFESYHPIKQTELNKLLLMTQFLITQNSLIEYLKDPY